MRLPRAIAVVLGIRQMTALLPESYCNPECPACKQEAALFETSTSCVANSSFINNCGSCQTCVTTYVLLNGTAGTPQSIQIQDDITKFLNYCENTTVSTIIQAYASQVSRISSWAAEAKSTPTNTQMISTSFSSPTPTSTGTKDWRSLHSVETAATAASPASFSSLQNSTAANTSTPSIMPQVTPQLSHTWVLGPVAGSVLGMSTVFIVIFFTRRKQRREMITTEEAPKPYEKPEEPSTRASSAAGDDIAQLHGEPVEAKELQTTEIYEMAAAEPVGNELVTPMRTRPKIRITGDGTDDYEEEEEEQWPTPSPLPISPLPALFAATELRDERMGRKETIRHQTYYHP